MRSARASVGAGSLFLRGLRKLEHSEGSTTGYSARWLASLKGAGGVENGSIGLERHYLMEWNARRRGNQST